MHMTGHFPGTGTSIKSGGNFPYERYYNLHYIISYSWI